MLAILAVVAGIALGVFCGMMPGIHSNTVASILSTLPFPPDILTYAIVAVFGTHLVVQFFPSIFLSIPDDSVVASVLPGHRLALAGRGREAATLCAASALISVFASSLLLPFSIAVMPALYSLVEPRMALVLCAATIYLLASERETGKIAIASFVFLLSGTLGVVTMRIGISDPLFPAFSGLFAGSGILLSFASKRKLPKQDAEKTELDFLPYVAAGVLFGMLSDLLPGIAAPAQIAVFASAVLVAKDARKFLALISSIAASHAVFAFGALLSIGKAREGSIAIINNLAPIDAQSLPAIIGALILSCGAGAYLLIKISNRTGAFFGQNTRALNLGALAYLICAIAIISGPLGLLLFATSTAIGLLPPMLGIRRTHVMGLIIVPSILLALQ